MITSKILHVLSCSVLSKSVLLISCVFWIFFQNAGSQLCFGFFFYRFYYLQPTQLTRFCVCVCVCAQRRRVTFTGPRTSEAAEEWTPGPSVRLTWPTSTASTPTYASTPACVKRPRSRTEFLCVTSASARRLRHLPSFPELGAGFGWCNYVQTTCRPPRVTKRLSFCTSECWRASTTPNPSDDVEDFQQSKQAINVRTLLERFGVRGDSFYRDDCLYVTAIWQGQLAVGGTQAIEGNLFSGRTPLK